MTRLCRELVGGSVLEAHGRRASRSTWLLVATLSSLGVCGCPVDDRALLQRPGLVLLPGSGGDDVGAAGAGIGGGSVGSGSEAGQMEAGQPGSSMGGTDAGAPGSGGSEQAGRHGVGGSAGGTGGNTSGGAGAGGGSGGHLMGRCPDLDGNFVFDCDETIAKNFGFDEDTSEWSTETNLEMTWQAIDADSHASSGSLSVEDSFTTDMEGTRMLGADQCIPVNEQTTYVFAVEVSVPDGAVGTKAGFQLLVDDADDCTGSTLAIASSDLSSGSSWKVVGLSYSMPKLAKSVLLRLVSIKPFRETPNGVLFDNVLVHPVD